MMPAVAHRIFLAQASALFTDHLPVGDGLVASGFVRELAVRGHELHVAVDRADLRDAMPGNVTVHELAAGGDRPTPVVRLDFMRRMRRLYERLERQAPFDVVHQLNPVDVGLSLVLPRLEAPLVLGPYVPDWAASGEGVDVNADMSPAAMRVKRALRTVEQRRATTILLSTPAAAAKLRAGWPSHVQVRDVPPGIDAERWTPGDGEGDSGQVLFLSNLEVRKGVLVTLDAFLRLADGLPGARLVIAGSGPEEEDVRRRAAASPHAGRIEVLGHVARDRVLDVMRGCGVYCLASYGEPFGMTALEAMACAKPVVATAEGGLGHIVDGGGGRQVPAGDASALARALREILADPALAHAMGRHNRRKIEQQYAWPRVIDRLEAAYADAIAAAREAARLRPPRMPSRARPRARA
jgi:glycosyltransferase involved in cell wall biosynthesis